VLVFIQRPISAVFLGIAALLIGAQLDMRWRRTRGSSPAILVSDAVAED